MFLLSSLFQRSHWRLSVGSLGFYVLDSVLKSVTGIELPKAVFTSRARWMPLIIEWNVFTNMFYILKNLLLFILVIFKLKCSNLIFNEIIVLNASYVCLHAFLLYWESPDPDPGRWTPHFWGGSVTPLIVLSLTTHAWDRPHKQRWRSVRDLGVPSDNISLPLTWKLGFFECLDRFPHVFGFDCH
jgi:hypothetical protein